MDTADTAGSTDSVDLAQPAPAAAPPPRVVLVTGKGGVGKTTTAAAMAVESARAGRRTLVMSTDVAHSLGDALDVDLRTSPTWERTLRVEERLHAQAVGSRTSVAADWGTLRDYLLTVLDSVGVDPVVAEELTALPGADEISALLTLGHHATSGEWDVIVVDCAPTAETLRLLALPEVLGWHLDRLLPAQRRLLTAMRPAAAKAAGLPMPDGKVLDVIATWRAHMAEVRDLLTSEHASVRIVLTPENVVIAEARRILTSLSLHGYAVDAVVVNRVIPVDDDPWRAAWNTAQSAGIATITASFHGTPVLVAPYLAGEPTGPDGLAALADQTSTLAGELAPLDAPVHVGGLHVEADGDEFVLLLPLPLARSGDVDLARRGDDLVVDVGGVRRVIALPSVLRRCIVKNAGVRSGTLRVRFERDEEVWPRGR